MIKTPKWKSQNLPLLSTFVQYVEDLKFWVNFTGRLHELPEKKIAKCFVSGLKPDIFCDEMYSRTFENLDDVIREVHEDLTTYRDFFADRVKNLSQKWSLAKRKETILKVWRLFQRN